MIEDIYNSPKSNLTDNDHMLGSLTLVETLFLFEGRINRSIYWAATLSLLALAFLFGYLADLIKEESFLLGLFTIVFVVLYIWISLAVIIKRWHDRNKSGWWVLIQFIPVIGPIWTLIEAGCLPGTDGINNYGHPNNYGTS